MNEMNKAEMRKKLGNITQLKELLFGEEIKEYNQKFDLYSQKLEDLATKNREFKLSVNERLQELENKLLEQINVVNNSLEKKIKYLDITTNEERQKIKGNLNNLSKQTHESISFLQNNIKNQNSNLKTEIVQSKTELDREMQQLKQHINDRLDSSFTELSTGKVSRSDLAEVLFELCLKLREPNAHLPTAETEKNSTDVGLILSEETSTINDRESTVDR